MTALRYVYAILPAAAPAVALLREGNWTGIDAQPVQAIAAAGLVAAVSTVAASEYEQEPLNRLVTELDWLAPRAAQHQQVNALLFDQTDALLPLAFGTVYRDDDGIARMLQTSADALLARLTAVAGCAEWVITLRRETDQALAAVEAESDALRALRDQIAQGSPGRAYLLTRQVDAVRRRELLALDARALAALDTVLPLVRDLYREELAGDRADGLLARASLLLERRREAEWSTAFEAMRQAWSPAGYDWRITGPWPPYRFSSREVALHADEA